jgi:hypothetical protein
LHIAGYNSSYRLSRNDETSGISPVVCEFIEKKEKEKEKDPKSPLSHGRRMEREEKIRTGLSFINSFSNKAT